MTGATLLRIVDASWTPVVNMLRVRCDACAREWSHRSDRWRVRCSRCGLQDTLHWMRHRYVAGR